MAYFARNRIEHGENGKCAVYMPGDLVPDHVAKTIPRLVELHSEEASDEQTQCAYVKRDGERCARPAESGFEHCRICRMQIARQQKKGR